MPASDVGDGVDAIVDMTEATVAVVAGSATGRAALRHAVNVAHTANAAAKRVTHAFMILRRRSEPTSSPPSQNLIPNPTGNHPN